MDLINVILIAVIVLGAIGLISAAVLFMLSKKFAVFEDPRIAEVEEALPGANCGGCGFPGCSGMANACVKAADAGSLDGLNCPVGGADVMTKVAGILGMEVKAQAPRVAVVRCNGTCENRPRIVEYDGARSCRVANSVSMGETACAYGCLGCGDCVAVCQFDAIHMNPESGLPEVNTEKCTACGACVKACPRTIIELREARGKKKMGVVVKCMNKDQGPLAIKACKVSCIACQKCVKACEFDAVQVRFNLSYIDSEKCKLCRKCEEACPRKAIHAINMPPRKVVAAPAAAKPAPSVPASPSPAAATAAANTAAAPSASAVASSQPAASAAPASPTASVPPAAPATSAPKQETPVETKVNTAAPAENTPDAAQEN
jgi:Na+-translocating ferredoxin:NAD+ oxidoreductase RNF subunit RnfB